MILNLGPGYTPPSSEIVSFIRDFKILDCTCCNQLMGFQHRITGMLFCTTDCIDLKRHKQCQQGGVFITPPSYSAALLEAADLYKEVNDKSLDSSATEIRCQSSGVKKMDVVNHFFKDIPDKVDPLLELEKPKITTTAEETLKLDEQKSVDVVDATAAQKHDLPVAKKYNKEVDEKPFAGSTTKIRSSQASGTKKMDVANPFFKNLPDQIDPLSKPKDNSKITATEEEALQIDGQKSFPPLPPRNVEKVASVSRKSAPPVGGVTQNTTQSEPQYQADSSTATASYTVRKSAPPVGGVTQKKTQLEPLYEDDSSTAPAANTVRKIAPPVGGVAQNKTQSEPQSQAESSTATTVAEVKKVVKEPEIKRFMWQNCKFSKNLVDGAIVKSTHIWNINKLQLATALDEQDLFGIQDKVNIHLQQVKKMTHPPIIDEMVIGEYNGDYYRGRVTKIKGDVYRVVFVDFGDAREMAYTEMYPVSEYIMKDPIFSVCVVLDGVPRLAKKVKPGRKLRDLVYGKMQLQMIDPLVVSQAEHYRAVLWVSDDRDLNKIVHEVVSKLEADVLTPAN